VAARVQVNVIFVETCGTSDIVGQRVSLASKRELIPGWHAEGAKCVK